MQAVLENKFVNKILNIPLVWNIAQSVIGAKKWKDEMYPSVFSSRVGTFLDFGCSSGNETHLFLDFDYYGVDLDSVAIRSAREKFKDHPNVRFFDTDIIASGFKKDFFDHVFFAGTAHHLTDNDLDRILDILMENLKQGGQLHFFEPISQPGKDSRITQFIIRSDQGKNTRTEETYKRMFTEKRYRTTAWNIFKSPDRFIKFPDFLYACITK